MRARPAANALRTSGGRRTSFGPLDRKCSAMVNERLAHQGYVYHLSLRASAHTGAAIRSPCNMSQFVPFPRRNGLPRRCAPRNDRWWTYPCCAKRSFIRCTRQGLNAGIRDIRTTKCRGCSSDAPALFCSLSLPCAYAR